MANAQNCDVGTTLAALNVGYWNDVLSSKNIQILLRYFFF